MNRFYNPSFIYGTVAGALKTYDLPDLAASLAPRKLIMAGITDGRGTQYNEDDYPEDIRIIIKSYDQHNAIQLLKIAYDYRSSALNDLLTEWIRQNGKD